MIDCTCSISIGCYDPDPEFYKEKVVKARKTHRCCECRRDIIKGETYKTISGKWDGMILMYKMCSDCKSLIENFFGRWTFEHIWEDMQEMISEQDGDINQTCVSKLTPTARGMVCDIIERIWQDREESGWYD
jgi:hypothetical protein